MAQVVLTNIGLEDVDNPESRDRVISFTSDGTADVKVTVQSQSGQMVQLCLQYGEQTPACNTGLQMTFTGQTRARSTNWRVLLRGGELGFAPVANLTIRFPARNPLVQLVDFRLAGVQAQNGFEARVRARTDGNLSFEASWPVAASYTGTVVDRDTSTVVDDFSGGLSTSANTTITAMAGHRYQLDFKGGTDVFEEVHFNASLVWP